MVVTGKHLFCLVRAMTAFIYAPNVEGSHHGSDSALVPGKRGIPTIWQMYVTVEVNTGGCASGFRGQTLSRR